VPDAYTNEAGDKALATIWNGFSTAYALAGYEDLGPLPVRADRGTGIHGAIGVLEEKNVQIRG
jgi:hypothetical protein